MQTEPQPAPPASDFSVLDNIAEDWAPATEWARRERRATASIEELRTFYERLRPLVPAIAQHLESHPVDRPLAPREDRLFRLAQMYMEAAWAVEVVGAPEEADQVPRGRWRITPVLEPFSRRKP